MAGGPACAAGGPPKAEPAALAPEVSREAADRMAQVLWQDDDEDRADDDDQADELGTSESADGQENDE